MNTKKIKVALLGVGTVGTGGYKLIQRRADVMVRTLEKGIVYKNKCREKQILLYVSNNENTEDAEVIALVQELFLPLGYELDIFWEKHFAVIGQEQTMQLDEIKLL